MKNIKTNKESKIMNINQDKRQNYYQIAYIFAIIATVISAIVFLIPLIWCIPMTFAIKKRKEYVEQNPFQEEPTSPLLLGVLALIFLGIISGIFIILCDTGKAETIIIEKEENK